MLRFRPRRTAGFTLVELAIVVGITGLLFSGLWRLMSSGNSQLREQAAADQLNQIANATRSFLASAQGQAMLRGPDATAAPAIIALALPIPGAPAGNAGCAAGLGDPAPSVGIGAFCAFLPAGFNAGSVNSYNQTYTIMARKLDGAATASPQNFDFMIMTNGGDVIGDNSGGRISANIGANGGFIYSAATCPAALPVVTNACGAFGGFTFDPAAAAAGGGFGAVNPGAGHIVTLNSKGGDNALTGFWLARPQIPGDAAFGFNTMAEDLRMGPNTRLGNRITNIEMAAPGGGAAGQINMRTGMINLNDGTVNPNAYTNNAINLENGIIQGPGQITITNPTIAGQTVVIDDTGSPNTGNTVEFFHSNALGSALFVRNFPAGADCVLTPTACTVWAESVTGNVSVNGVLTATVLTGGSFIYNSDRSLKRDLIPIPRALDRLTKLNGYQFAWKNSGRADMGVVAQEVHDVFPELVVGKDGSGQMGVEYGNLVAPIIEAIKELKTRNELLQHQITAQAREIAELKHAKSVTP